VFEKNKRKKWMKIMSPSRRSGRRQILLLKPKLSQGLPKPEKPEIQRNQPDKLESFLKNPFNQDFGRNQIFLRTVLPGFERNPIYLNR
jgi:hypothetical protein